MTLRQRKRHLRIELGLRQANRITGKRLTRLQLFVHLELHIKLALGHINHGILHGFLGRNSRLGLHRLKASQTGNVRVQRLHFVLGLIELHSLGGIHRTAFVNRLLSDFAQLLVQRLTGGLQGRQLLCNGLTSHHTFLFSRRYWLPLGSRPQSFGPHNKGER